MSLPLPSNRAGQVPLAPALDAVVSALEAFIQDQAARAVDLIPPEDDVYNISLPDWRRALAAWCLRGPGRRALSRDVLDGLAAAITRFSDDELRNFLYLMG